jgi:hypothetical protein
VSGQKGERKNGHSEEGVEAAAWRGGHNRSLESTPIVNREIVRPPSRSGSV